MQFLQDSSFSLVKEAMAERAVSVNYILRIYRFQKDEPVKLMGVVEEVGAKRKKAFTNLKELWEILSSSEELKDKEGVGTIQNP